MNTLKHLISIDSGRNETTVSIGSLDIYFSYETPVAFRDNGRLRVSENVWSTTTGKHLNRIDGGDKQARLPRSEFEAELKGALVQHGLAHDIQE